MPGGQLAVVCAGLVSLAACDSLFGLDRTYSIDAAPDLDAAPPGMPVIVSIKTMPALVHIGEHVSVTVKFHRMPMEELAFSLSASDGMFDPFATTVTLDELGIGEVTVMYTAPGTAGMVTFTAQAAGEMRDQMVTVIPNGRALGQDHPGSASISATAGAVIATKVTLVTPEGVDALGVWTVGGGVHAKAAIYTDAGGPSVLLYMSGEILVTPGRNVFSGTSTELGATSYWLAVAFDNPAAIQAEVPNTGYSKGLVVYANGFPPAYNPATFMTVTGPQPMIFATLTP